MVSSWMLRLYEEELEEMQELNGAKDVTEAFDMILNEMFAGLKLFGCKSQFSLPDGFDLEEFRKDYNRTIRNL